MKRGSSTSFEESPGKYPRIDGPEDLENGAFQARPQEFEASNYHSIETEGTPTMVNSATFDQSKVAQRVSTEFDATIVTAEFETPSFNGVSDSSDVPTIATTFKQENNEQKQCQFNGSSNVTVECLGTD